jgi:hypothetical protein
LGNLKGLLRSQNGVFCEIFRVNQIFLNAFAEKRYFKEVPFIIFFYVFCRAVLLCPRSKSRPSDLD